MKILAGFASEGKSLHCRRLTRALYLRTTSARGEGTLWAASRSAVPAVSRGVETELRTTYAIGGSPVRIVPNAADTKIFHPISADERLAWRQANGLPENEKICIFSGGEWARKGLDLAIRAMAGVDARLFVAGDDADRERFQSMARTIRRAGDLRWIPQGHGDRHGGVRCISLSKPLRGFQPRYHRGDVACGLPSLRRRSMEPEDFIQPGVNGEFVEPDPAHIAQTLKTLLAAQDRSKEMGVAAREIVERLHVGSYCRSHRGRLQNAATLHETSCCQSFLRYGGKSASLR